MKNIFHNTHALVALVGLMSLVLIVSGCRASKKATKNSVTPGTAAPDFSLVDEANTLHTLSKMRGSRVALYFYPKDQTPGCTAQACSIRDSLGELRDKNIHVWGISYDSPASHAALKQKYHLTFPLLSDSNKQVAALYGVKGFLMAKRVTFLIDEQGILVGIINDVDVKSHAQQILDAFEAGK